MRYINLHFTYSLTYLLYRQKQLDIGLPTIKTLNPSIACDGIATSLNYCELENNWHASNVLPLFKALEK